MRALITGSREWNNPETMREAFRSWWREVQPSEVVTLVSGNARGADRMAERIWREVNLPVEVHPAKWSELGKSAGFVRNQEMVDLGADVCFAFFKTGAGNRGTRHCSEAARKAGIEVLEVWG